MHGLGTLARDLGPRGSRAEVASSDPASRLPFDALRLVAAVPGWWQVRAAAVGLDSAWQSVEHALGQALPVSIEQVDPDPHVTGSSTAEDLGNAYVAALSPGVRARHGRHYTPPTLAAELWAMARRALAPVFR